MDVQVARMTTFALAGICGLLLLTALVQLAGYGRGYGWLPSDSVDSESLAAEIDRKPFKLPVFSSFSEVEQRPLFNEDRKPMPVSEAEPEVAGPPPVPLNVTLTGVILVRKTETTPELRIAMVRDNARNESVALKVGMPLSGDQAGWTLASVGPRVATFKNASDETAEIELHTAATLPPPPPPGGVRRPGPVAPALPGSVAPEKKENAADSDLAKRIEERRRQMREEAERLRSERSGNSPTDQKK
jgi:general secretion pathway protein N